MSTSNFFLSSIAIVLCTIFLNTIARARKQVENTVILAGQTIFYSTVVFWISSEKRLLWQQHKMQFCCFQTFFSPLWKNLLFFFVFSNQFFSYSKYCIWVESIVSLCCPSNLILFLSTENNPVLFSGSICCFKKQKEKLFCTLEGNRNHISLNCYDLIRPKQPTGTRYCKCMHYGECKGD